LHKKSLSIIDTHYLLIWDVVIVTIYVRYSSVIRINEGYH